MATLHEARAPGDVESARQLFAEYARAVDEPCCFAGFERELAALPGPPFRGRGIGRALAEAAIAAARRAGYGRMVLDSLPSMREALVLYRELGFREVPPYLAQPTPGATCFELKF